MPALHDPDHPPAPEAHRQLARRSTWIGVVVNLALSVAQILLGNLAHSQALIADGLHSLSDLIADGVVLFATRLSAKDADPEHPFGHHRFENGASLVIGLLLAAVGAGMLWAALQKLQQPQSIPTVASLALWVALGALAAKELLFRYQLKIAQEIKSALLIANAWHARSDAASSLLVALGILGNLLGYPLLDPLAALVVGLFIIRLGLGFTWDALHDLMDRAATEEEVAAIRTTLLQTPGIQGVHDLRTRKTGDMIMVDVHLEIDGDLSVRAGHDIAVQARSNVMRRHRVLNVMTHVDPVRSRV